MQVLLCQFGVVVRQMAPLFGYPLPFGQLGRLLHAGISRRRGIYSAFLYIPTVWSAI